MAIAPVTGSTTSNSVAGTTLAFASTSLTNGDLIVVSVSIDSASVTVSGIADTGLNTYTLQSSKTNGSCHVEIWTAPVTSATAARVITVTLSGSALASAAFEEYSGVASGIGNIGTASSGTGTYASDSVATQDTSNWTATAIAAVTSSGNTFTAVMGTIRQSVIPALTTTATAMIDNSSIAIATVTDALFISASSVWVAVTIELRTGATATDITETALPSSLEYGSIPSVPTLPPYSTVAPSYFNPVPVAEDLLGGITGVSYSEAISAQGGTSPYTFTVVSGSLPTSTALNSSTGIISGTPTASGTYTFTIEVTDTNGYIGSQVFQIIISNPVVSGGSFTFIS